MMLAFYVRQLMGINFGQFSKEFWVYSHYLAFRLLGYKLGCWLRRISSFIFQNFPSIVAPSPLSLVLIIEPFLLCLRAMCSPSDACLVPVLGCSITPDESSQAERFISSMRVFSGNVCPHKLIPPSMALRLQKRSLGRDHHSRGIYLLDFVLGRIHT